MRAESQAIEGPFAGGSFGGQRCPGAADGAPEAHLRGIANQLAAFAWPGRRRGIWLNLDGSASQGDAG